MTRPAGSSSAKRVSRPYIHPRTPSKLRAAFRAAKNMRGEGCKYHILAERVGVNVGQLHNLIHKGIEPTDKTEKGQATRAAMFLPRKKRSARGKPKTKEPIKNYMHWWTRVLTKEIRNDIIRRAWKENTNEKTKTSRPIQRRGRRGKRL